MEVIGELLGHVLAGSSPAVTALLIIDLILICWVYYRSTVENKKERTELVEKFQKQIDEDRKDLLEIIDKYQEGQISVVEALTEIKILIATIGAKL